jgi:hypothetical protein
MNQKIGIFFQHTTCTKKIRINQINFDHLNTSFDHIYIYDIDNSFSNELKEHIIQINKKNHIVEYIVDNYFETNQDEYFSVSNIIYVLHKIKNKYDSNKIFSPNNFCIGGMKE